MFRNVSPPLTAVDQNGRDVRERLRVMREHGLHPIARIVVAKDPGGAAEELAKYVRKVLTVTEPQTGDHAARKRRRSVDVQPARSAAQPRGSMRRAWSGPSA